MAEQSSNPSPVRTAARLVLGAALVFAGAGHLSFARKGFRAQVPRKLAKQTPYGKDDVVLMSGIVEMGLGGALLLLPKEQRRIGKIAGGFFTAIYPGNLSQFLRKDSALGLDTDQKRAVRLIFQPLLVAWALWSTRNI